MQALIKRIHKLPEPDAVSLAHSDDVAAYIRGEIRDAGGIIGFAEFMHHALYAPGLGYYTAGSGKFGAAGDFVTAPEASAVFSRVLGRQVAEVFEQLGDPDLCNILEFGAGSGALAVELLRKLERLGALPVNYFIIEVSADLQQRQAEAIAGAMPAYVERVRWLSSMPASFCGVVIANEVLDALPVERFSKHGQRLQRQSVVCAQDGFAWQAQAAPEILVQAVSSIEQRLGSSLPDGYVSEVSLGAADWISQIAANIRQGFVFLFDYGVSEREYYAPDRSDGWLRCHFRHRAHSDPLILPGIQDLTAWVNFSTVAESAHDGDLTVAGYVTQSSFLLSGGLQQELQEFGGLSTAAQIELSQQVKVLTMPGEMGENIKCLGLSKGPVSLSGMPAAADRAHTL